jgi:hypothetical protein
LFAGGKMSDSSILKQLKITDAADLDARFAEIAGVVCTVLLSWKKNLVLSFFFFADFLLNQVDLVVGGGATRYELAEIEFYYCSAKHRDVFAHQDPMQKSFGEWYFHRTGPGKAYKEGTYKGLDLAIGNSDAFCGVLIRSLRTDKGDVVQGSCLCVNSILAALGHKGVTAFADELLASKRLGFASTDASHPLRLVPAAKRRSRDVHTSMRVGLTLKKKDNRKERLRFIGAEFRFTTAADVIRKGAPQQVASLANRGHDNAAIAHITKLKPKVIEGYVALFKAGKKKPLTGLFGAAIKPADYAELFGRWVQRQASGGADDDNDAEDVDEDDDNDGGDDDGDDNDDD